MKPQTHVQASAAITSYEVRKLSEDADRLFSDAIHKKEGWRYFELLNNRLIALNNSIRMISKRDELDCIDAIIENDQAHIEYLKNNFKKNNANFYFSNIESTWLSCVEKSTQKVEQTLYEKRLKHGFIVEIPHVHVLESTQSTSENKKSNNKENDSPKNTPF